MSSNTNRTALIALAIAACVCSFGCPDKSYQAPLPDYSNMTDEGEAPESPDEG